MLNFLHLITHFFFFIPMLQTIQLLFHPRLKKSSTTTMRSLFLKNRDQRLLQHHLYAKHSQSPPWFMLLHPCPLPPHLISHLPHIINTRKAIIAQISKSPNIIPGATMAAPLPSTMIVKAIKAIHKLLSHLIHWIGDTLTRMVSIHPLTLALCALFGKSLPNGPEGPGKVTTMMICEIWTTTNCRRRS